MDYDPEICITAGELRESGIPVPESIPDCGWIPRGSMRSDPESWKIEQNKEDGTKIDISCETLFTKPFIWVEGIYALESDKDDG